MGKSTGSQKLGYTNFGSWGEDERAAEEEDMFEAMRGDGSAPPAPSLHLSDSEPSAAAHEKLMTSFWRGQIPGQDRCSQIGRDGDG